MDFIKKNKVAFMISAAVLVGFVVVWWWKNKTGTAVVTTATPVNAKMKVESGAISINTDDASIVAIAAENKKKVDAKVLEIMQNAEWYSQIANDSAQQGYTLQQALAINAIWALKKDGAILPNAFGDGEWGHIDYVKANY